MSLLSEKGSVSTMRWAVMAITISVAMLIEAIVFYIILSTINKVDVEWMGVAALITASATLMTGVLGMKSSQKKNEAKESVATNG